MSLPCKVRFTNSGKTTEKLYVNVRTIPIITSETHSTGSLRTYRRPSRT